jgi:hypothetical protein
VEPPPPPAVTGRHVELSLPGARAQRVPLGILVGGLVAVLLLVALAGAALALMLRGDGGNSPALPGTGAATSRPLAGDETADASPVEGSSASPGGGTFLDGQLVDAENVSIELPADWTVLNVDANTIEAVDPGGGRLHLLTGTDVGAITVEQLQQQIVAGNRELNPDTQVCQEPKPMRVPGGPADGLGFMLCFTSNAEGGAASSAAAVHVVGIQGGPGSAPGLTRFFSYSVFATAGYLDTFLGVVDRLPPPTWKGYFGP